MWEACSTQTSWTVRPRMSMPRMAWAWASASWRSLATLMPPALPRPADLDLGLDHAGVAHGLGGLDRLGHRGGRTAGGHRDALAREELLALVLEQVHERRAL